MDTGVAIDFFLGCWVRALRGGGGDAALRLRVVIVAGLGVNTDNKLLGESWMGVSAVVGFTTAESDFFFERWKFNISDPFFLHVSR
jgi:hypothetical protein